MADDLQDQPQDEPQDQPDQPPEQPEEPKPKDWQAEARRAQRWAKEQRKKAEELEARLKDREELDKSEHEKAIEAARGEGEKAAREAAEKERRADRLENAIIRQAAQGVKLGSGDDTRTVRFQDLEDAQEGIERMIRRGDLDPDDLYDDKGQIRTGELTKGLQELLERKPHLAAREDNGSPRRPQGSADAGKGSGPKGADEMSVEEHLKRIQSRGPRV